MKKLFIIVVCVLVAAAGSFAASKQVMPAKRREQIVQTAKAIFEPEVRTSLKASKMKSPFGGSAMPIK